MKPNVSVCNNCEFFEYAMPHAVPREVEKLAAVRMVCAIGKITIGHYRLKNTPIRAMNFEEIRAAGTWEPICWPWEPIDSPPVEVPDKCPFILEHAIL